MKKVMMLVLVFGVSILFVVFFVYFVNWISNKFGDVQIGGIFCFVNFQDFKILNFFVLFESFNLFVVLSVGLLLGYNFVIGNYVFYMVEKYIQFVDKCIFIFDICKGMKWSDGKLIIVDDWIIVYIIDFNKDVGSNIFDYWIINNQLIKVIKVDSNIFKVVFFKVDVIVIEFLFGIFLFQFIYVFMFVWKVKGVQGIKDMWIISINFDNIVISGFFMLDCYVCGECVILKKNFYFGEWNKDSVGKLLFYLDGIQINIVVDVNVQFVQFLVGNFDIYSFDNCDKLVQVKLVMDGGKVKGMLIFNVSVCVSSDFMVFNMDDSVIFKIKLFFNVKFCQVMSMLMNCDVMVDFVFGGFGEFIYILVYFVYKDWIFSGMDKYKFNFIVVVKLLVELGFIKKGSDGILVDKVGNKFEFILIINVENNCCQSYVKVIQDEVKKVGVKINVSVIVFNQMIMLFDVKDNFGCCNFDVIIIGLIGGGQVYFVFGFSVVECKGFGDGGNLYMFNQSNKCCFFFEIQVVNLFWKGCVEFDFVKCKVIVVQIQRNEMENQFYIQLVVQIVYFVWIDCVQGEYNCFQINSLNVSIFFGFCDIVLIWIKC